jgi:hypothetical protein
MKTLRGVLVAAVLLAVGLLGASAAFAVGTLTVDPNPNDCPPNYSDGHCVYFGESGTPVTRTITLSNDHASESVTVENIQLVRYDFDDPTEVDNFDFSVVGDTVPFEIAALESVDVDVTWTPSPQPRDRAILRITHNAGDPIDVDLGGGQPYFFEPPGLGAGASALDLGNVNIGQPAATGGLISNQIGFNSHDRIRVRHSGPAFPNVTVDTCPTEVPNAPVMTVRCTHAEPVELTTDAPRLVYRTGFHPTAAGPASTTVRFNLTTPSGAEVVDIDVSGTGVGGAALYRVNSGGPIVNVNASSQSFTRDEAGNQSAYFIHGVGTDGSTGSGVNTSDSSIPNVTPDGIFTSYRLQGNGGAPILYQFPVEPGLYSVRMYFAETQVNGPGARVFDVSINDGVVMPDLDPFAVAGKNRGFARTFLIDAVDLIEVELERRPARAPILSGVEIITGGSAELSASNLSFGSVPVGLSATKTLTIKNNAGPTGSAVRVDSVSMSGSGDFEVAGLSNSKWVAPGETLKLNATFEPSSSGARSATATFNLHGVGPITANLSGRGVVNTAPVAASDTYQTNEDTTLVVAAPGVLGNDSDADGSPLSAVLATGPADGSVDLGAKGGFTYTPDAGFSGTDSFTYRASDGLDNSGVAKVTITVNAVDDISFTDIDGSTFTQDILWLAKVGITRGCNPPVNDRFCPDDFVTRGQMAAFFVRGLDLTDRLDDPFVDDDGDTFEADIERMAAADITRGCNPPVNDRFCPDDFVTRGQMAAFFHRAADLLGLPG